MDLVDLELEEDAFLWDTADEVADEEAGDGPEVVAVLLRNTALEALDEAMAEDAELRAAAAAASLESQHVEVAETDAEDVEADEIDFDIEADDAEDLESSADDAADAVVESDLDADYVQLCMALFDEKYPDGMDALFYDGLTQGLFALTWGPGLMSGNAEWTDEDFMLMDAILIKLEDQGLNLEQMWEEMTVDLVDRLFPDGFNVESLDAIYEGNGPISDAPEWNELDFQAMDMLTDLLWEALGEGDFLDLFNEAFPDGIATLFPEGYSDEAFDAIAWGNGLISGEPEWTEADYMAFEGLWQTLENQGVEPYSDEPELEEMPIVIDDGYFPFPFDGGDYGFAYPMPIVIDDGDYEFAPIVIDDGYYDPTPIVIGYGAMELPFVMATMVLIHPH
ncbi:MAG: hypothetical protein NWR47_08070 [Aestuariivirgaceae bacterium]|nr:hypothetical protein [Aestuariivirgaceae bacterium]